MMPLDAEAVTKLVDAYSASIPRWRHGRATQRAATGMQIKPRLRGALLAPAHDHPRKLPEVPEADNPASGIAILATDRETATELANFTARNGVRHAFRAL